MNLRLKLELLAVGLLGLGLVFLYFVWQHHEQQLGAARVEASDAKALADQRAEEAKQALHDKQTTEEAVNALQTERDHLAATLAATPVPVIRVCAPNPANNSGVVPGPTGVASGTGQAPAGSWISASVPGGDSGGVNVGAEVQLLAVGIEQLSGQLRAILEWERGLK